MYTACTSEKAMEKQHAQIMYISQVGGS